MSHDIHIIDIPQQPVAVVRGHATADKIPDFVGSAFSEVGAFVVQHHLLFSGPPFGRYVPGPDGSFDIEAGFPIDGSAESSGRVVVTTLPGGPAAMTVHVGPYDTVAKAYEDVGKWLESNGYEPTGAPWERYLDEPSVVNPRTEILFPCALRHAMSV